MQKHEWRKKEKQFYQPKKKPEVVAIPAFKFAVLAGEGNPNSPFFAECITALYSVSYAVKMTPKKMETPPIGYFDYTVYPLEGVWDLNEEARAKYDGTFNKDDLVFNIMIRQPDFVTQEFFQEMLELTQKKKPNPLLKDLRFEEIKEGKCVQMLHIGPYDDEPASFEIMERFYGSLRTNPLVKNPSGNLPV